MFSIRDLAGELGVSTKTIYQNFESKEHIIRVIAARALEEMAEAERAIRGDEALTIRQKLQKALAVLPLGFVFHDIRILRELQQRYPEQWEAIDSVIQNGWDYIRELAAEGMRTGIFRPFDIELFIQVYIGALYRLMDYSPAAGRMLSLEETLEQMTKLLLDGIIQQ